jgi:hypothetical protein
MRGSVPVFVLPKHGLKQAASTRGIVASGRAGYRLLPNNLRSHWHEFDKPRRVNPETSTRKFGKLAENLTDFSTPLQACPVLGSSDDSSPILPIDNYMGGTPPH